MTKWIRLAAVAGVLTLALAACGSSGGSKSDSGDGSSTSSTTKASKVDESSLTGCKAGALDPGTEASKQRMSVDPCENLTNGQMVTVSVVGFTAGKVVGINQCSTETDDTGSGCNLEGLKTLTVGSDGTGTAQYPVIKGPFGKDNVVCAPPTQCLLSIGELAAGDVERADGVDINFAA